MSFDTVVSLGLFAGAMFLMVRFGCGSHMMGHAHGHGASRSESEGGDSGRRFANSASPTQMIGTPAMASKTGADSAAPEGGKTAHRHGCC